MLGIDTNVLVRLLVEDDPAQTRRARKLVDSQIASEEPVLVSLLVLLETEWVLRSRYVFDKGSTAALFTRLLEAREVIFEDEASIEEALYTWKDTPCGFADCLIIARNRRLGCAGTATFDVRAARLPGTVPL